MSVAFEEGAWWGACGNTFHEEQKQLVYAKRMGLLAEWGGAHPPSFDVGGRSVIDIGGGPVSLLLKCVNLGEALVVDPGEYPPWVTARYAACRIEYKRGRAEEIPSNLNFDEAWIYNVLQHVDDPPEVVARARAVARTVRIFEWVNVPAYPGHPHELRASDLDRWFEGKGFATQVDQDGAVGDAYYGVFARRSPG